MLPLLRAGLALAVAASCVAAGDLPARADTTTPGSAYAAVAKVGPAVTITPIVTTSGLTAILQPVLDTVVTPIVAALGALSGTMVTTTVNGLTTTAFSATTPSSAQSAGYSTPCASLQAGTCYSAAAAAVAVPPVETVSLGAVQGYTTATTSGYSGNSQVASATVTVLGVSAATTGLVSSAVTCANSATSCTPASNVAGLSLMGTAVLSVPASQSQALTGTQLLSGLGLGSLVSGALGVTVSPGTAATLTVTATSSSAGSSGSAEAWGVRLGVDLAVNLTITVLGLASVTISVPSGLPGSGTPDLLDLKLAESTASAGSSTTGPNWVPPGLT